MPSGTAVIFWADFCDWGSVYLYAVFDVDGAGASGGIRLCVRIGLMY